MLLLALLIIASATVTLLCGVGSWISWRRGTLALQHYRCEKVRSRFAIARCHLMRLVAEGELDPNSATFRSLYFLQTSVMRRPDKYDELWRKFFRALAQVKKKDRQDEMLSEAPQWTPRTKKMVVETADALMYMIYDLSAVFRGVGEVVGGLRWLSVRCGLSTNDLADRVQETGEHVQHRRHPKFKDVEDVSNTWKQAAQTA